MVMSDFRPEAEIWPFSTCAMHLAIIIGTVRLLSTWLWGRYHVPQNAFLVVLISGYMRACVAHIHSEPLKKCDILFLTITLAKLNGFL